MLRTRAFLSMLALAAATSPSWAASQARAPITDHVAQIDGPIVAGTDATGRSWAVWSYRASGEFDIAVTTKTADAISWSAPTFIGWRDGIDQVDPVLAFDNAGGVYLAFGARNPSRIGLAFLAPGAATWSVPTVVPGSEGGTSPALRIVRDRVVVAFRTASRLVMTDLPTIGSVRPLGIQDGPDGVDPLGVTGGADDNNSGGSSGSNNSGGGTSSGGNTGSSSPLPTGENHNDGSKK